MANYFESKNDNGKVVIDDTTRMLSLLRCGVVTSMATCIESGAFSWYGNRPNDDRRVGAAGLYRLTLDANEKLVAFSVPNDGNVAVCTSQVSTSVVNVIIFRTEQSSESIASIAGKIKLYIFGEDYTANNRCGIQIFNASGNLVFKNTDYMMNVKGYWNMSIDMFRKECNGLPASFLIKENAGNMAVVCSSYAGNWVKDPNNSIPPYCGVYAVSRTGNNLYAKLIVMYWFSNCYEYYNGLNDQSSALLVDITNAPI